MAEAKNRATPLFKGVTRFFYQQNWNGSVFTSDTINSAS